MNDPGFDKPISDDAKEVENEIGLEDKDEEEDEEALLQPSRWWFASTAFPLIAGTFGPMASAFSICALVVHWRVYIPPGSDEDNATSIEDPKWLIGINAAQLAIALISNLFLLLNMARRVRFEIAQPITIIGWYISSFALVGLIASVSGPLRPEPSSDHAFSQGYYYAVFAAVLYFMVASLMAVTVWGARKGHYDKEFQLTMSQRTLMLQTISFLAYLLLGGLVYSHIEGWLFLDALYWADFTLLTVGIGDFAPETHLGRGLLFPFAIGGIIILGLVIGSIRSLVLDRGKVKIGARIVEKERLRLLKNLEKKNADVLEPVTEENTPISQIATKPLDDYAREYARAERRRREEEFKLMRSIQEKAAVKRRWTSLIISGTTWLVLWLAGAAVFQGCEYRQNWSYFVSLYFAYTSLLTIGYGDIYPESNSGKPFFVFWSLLAVPSLTILISNMGDTIVKEVRDLTIWIGNFTVLPGEQGVIASMKETAHKLTRGRVFSDSMNETPPGILGETNRRVKNDNESTGRQRAQSDTESAAESRQERRTEREVQRAEERGKENDKLPRSRRHYHSILIKEISKVIKHLNSSPPRKYTFEEWAWFLRLVGEDESSSDLHRSPTHEARANEEGPAIAKAGEGQQGQQVKWSWVGDRSPLMGHKDEPEWVLERLTSMLDRELEAMRREETEERRGNEMRLRRRNNDEKGDGPFPDTQAMGES